MYTIGVDVGGTYTDLVATDETGRTIFAKSPSTPADQSIGVMAGLEELARRLGVTRDQMLAVTDRLVHGTTVAPNALLERKGAKVALLNTAGHRDVIDMREGLEPDRYDLRTPLPQTEAHERVSTNVVNAYVEPVVQRYLTNLERRLVESGFRGSLFIELSHGGMAPVEEESRLAARTVLSGAAGGLSGERRCAEL